MRSVHIWQKVAAVKVSNWSRDSEFQVDAGPTRAKRRRQMCNVLLIQVNSAWPSLRG